MVPRNRSLVPAKACQKQKRCCLSTRGEKVVVCRKQTAKKKTTKLGPTELVAKTWWSLFPSTHHSILIGSVLAAALWPRVMYRGGVKLATWVEKMVATRYIYTYRVLRDKETTARNPTKSHWARVIFTTNGGRYISRLADGGLCQSFFYRMKSGVTWATLDYYGDDDFTITGDHS